MRKVLQYIVFLVSGVLPLTAQSESEGDKRSGAGRSAWFACLSKPEGLENPVKVLSGGKLAALELPEFMTSDAVAIPSDGILRIVREAPDPVNQGKMKYLILAEAKIPEGVHEALVILSPLAKPEGDLLFQTKVQDLASFKGGDRLFINLSDTNVGVKIGDTSVAVPARQANIYSAPKLAEPANMPIIYSYYHPEQEKWKLLTATTVVIMPTRREICVFNNGRRLGKIEKHGILFPVKSEIP
jgi:hypothetical protein